jgi:hypothetical protein
MFIDRYNGFGLSLTITSIIMAIFTYMFIGLGPFFAFWIGLLVIGTSMVLTPTVEGIRLSQHAVLMILNAFENVARVVEGLRIRGRTIYREIDGDVYIVIGESNNIDYKKFINYREGKLAVIFKSPISREHLEGLLNTCEAIESIVVTRLGIVESSECIDHGDRIYVKFNKIKIYPVKSLENTIGSVYGIISASIATLTKNSGVYIESESCNDFECIINISIGV